MFIVDYSFDGLDITQTEHTSAAAAEVKARKVSRELFREHDILVYVFRKFSPAGQRVFYGGKMLSTEDGYTADVRDSYPPELTLWGTRSRVSRWINRSHTMTLYQEVIAEFTDLNPVHIESLLLEEHYTINGLDTAAFRKVCRLANRMGAKWLEEQHNEICCL